MAHFKVLILAGQSNCSGEAPINNYSADQILIKRNPLVFYNGVLEFFEAGSNNRRRAISEQKGGWEIELAKQISDNYSENVIFLKHEEGGTGLYDAWIVSETNRQLSQYAMMIARIDAFEAYMAHSRPTDTYEYVALCWNQGEQDSGNEAGSLAYEANFTTLLNALRTRIGVPTLPYYDWRISDLLVGSGAFKGNVNAAKESLRTTFGATLYDTDAADGFSFIDAFHYDAPSYTKMGRDLYTDLIANGHL